MKRVLLFVVASALVLGVIPATSATAKPATAYDIVFDGYCDGLHFNLPSAGLGTPTTTDGDQTGCVSGGIFGTFSAKKKALYFTIPGFSTFTQINLNHTWTHYGLSGNLIYIVNSGTWSPGTPQDRAAPPSNTARGGASKTIFRPNAVIDIVFDGYCDGMEFHVPSAGLGTPGTVDGNRTGCSSEGLMGAGPTKLGSTGALVVTFNIGFWIQTAVLLDHTWVHYSVSGDLIYILNSGTWSFGSPVGRAAGRPSSV